jgi:hypothetical protein
MKNRMDSTGYANGALLEDEDEVREYFTLATMEYMFGPDHGFGEAELAAMAASVLAERLHMERP